MSEKFYFKTYKTPNFQNPSLLVGWEPDIGNLGLRVIDYLNKKLEAEEIGEIEPEGFSTFRGVQIQDNVIQFPESKFYACQKYDLLLLKSSRPQYEHYRFVTLVLDFAQLHCKARELYTIGGIASLMAHTTPRRISTVVNQPKFKEMLASYGLETGMNYESPPGERPSLSSLLSWSARRRNIGGVNLWTIVPLYLAAVEDLKAISDTLWFLDRRFQLNLDFGDFNLEISRQNERLTQLREQSPEINKLIGMLERGIMLNVDENEKLTEEVTAFLKES